MSEVTEVRVPVENVNDETVAIIRWLVDDGARVEQGDPLVLAETSKTSFDVPAPVSGFVWRVAAADTDVPTGSVLCYVGAAVEDVREAAASVHARPANGVRHDVSACGAAPQGGDGASTRGAALQGCGTATAAPAAEETRRPARLSARAAALAGELGIDPAVFAGRGLVREQDVQEYHAARQKQSIAAGPGAAPALRTDAPAHAPAPAQGVPTRVEPLARSKKVEVRHLRAGWSSTLPSSVTVSVPTAGFFSAAHGDAEPGLASAAVIYETARLLRQYPRFNAYYAAGEARLYEDVNIGYAIDLGSGLKVPVVRHADRKSLGEIAAEKQQFLVDYIDDSLPVESLAGGTFTLSDLSAEGVLHFQPMINEGQSAILGVCAEAFATGSPSGAYNLVLAFDHQLADGRTAALFLKDLRERLMAHEASLSRRRDDRAAEEPRCAVCQRPASELEDNRHFLVRTVPRAGETERVVCTICLQDW